METPPPDSSRRQVLTWIAAAAAFTGLAAWFGRSGKQTAPATTSTAPVAPPTKESVTMTDATTLDPAAMAEMHPVYGPLLNTEFTIAHPDDATATCKLVAVSPVTTLTGPKGDYTAFTLLFEAKPTFLVEGGICRVTHPKLNAMDLFLSPVGRAKGEVAHLEACFTERV